MTPAENGYHGEAPVFAWRVHLARERPLRALAGVTAMVGFAVGVGVLYRSVGVGVFAAAMLFGSTATYWLPRRYAVYADRVDIAHFGLRRPVAYPWNRFRACFSDGTALFLSPTGRPSGLARFRGLTLFLPPSGGAIADFVAEHVGESHA
jgi:hypothetical protein